MKPIQPMILIRMENALLLVLTLYGYFSVFHYSWVWFLIFLLVPDISGIGYLINPAVGAYCYNAIHVLFLPVLLALLGLFLTDAVLIGLGFIWLSHIFLDRTIGFGLKYTDDARHTYG
ncbi:MULTISPECIES: DUF4260 family protein [unclassified Sporolactobacillus]|uniref:DUF4260 family protein n=1 Tax=unclassified Sporolactobacillus TaxID=2628533 RepID=UPI0023678B1E|nr:DUF4260 family protein [Sporolactobacillus sp. CQH2019]MDD9150629.1 DUF4260 family protein [Sporolactobacillus sp. CQH2019]